MKKLLYIIISVLLLNSVQSFFALDAFEVTIDGNNTFHIDEDYDDATGLNFTQSFIDVEDVEESITGSSESKLVEFPQFANVFYNYQAISKKVGLILFEADTSPPYFI